MVAFTKPWPGLVSDVIAYISECEVCKSTKSPNFTLRPPLEKTPESQRFFQRFFIDFLGPYPRSRSGSIGIFIVLDNFSKYVFLKPVKKIDSSVVIKYLENELFMTFGVPEVILSDNGCQCRAKTFQKLMEQYVARNIIVLRFFDNSGARDKSGALVNF